MPLCACRLLPSWRQSWLFHVLQDTAKPAGLQLRGSCRTHMPGMEEHPTDTILLPLTTSPTMRQQAGKLHCSLSSQSSMQASSICSKRCCTMLPSTARKLIKQQQRGANDVQMNTSISVRQKAASLGRQDGGTLPALLKVLQGLIRKYLQCALELESTKRY